MNKREDIEEHLKKMYPLESQGQLRSLFRDLYEINGFLYQKKESYFHAPPFRSVIYVEIEKKFGIKRDSGGLRCSCGRSEAQQVALIENSLIVTCFCQETYIVNVS